MNANKIYADGLLRAALNWNQPDVAERLREAMQAGANPNGFDAVNPGSVSPLVAAVKAHDLEAVAILLLFGADPLMQCRQEAYAPTALQVAKGIARDGEKIGFAWSESATKIANLLELAAELEGGKK